MRPRQVAWLLIVPAALVLSLGVLAAAEDKGAEAKKEAGLLESKGLRKVGQFFVLSDEAALKKKLRDLDPLRKKATDAQRKAAEADKLVDQKKLVVNQCLQQRHELEVQLNNVRSVEIHNRMVNAMNELSDRIQILEKSLQEDKGAKAVRAAATEVTEQYIEAVMQLRKQCKEVKAKYTALAADEAIKQAIGAVNKAESATGKLGPSSDFAMVDLNLKKMEGNLVSETIPMRRGDGDVWSVSATFNGQHATDLMVDTGASTVVLPHLIAAEVGLTPSATDPEVTCVLADGHTIKCKMVYAKTLRVGKFTVEHVECGIMPPDCQEAAALLGQSFLKHFTFRIDNANGRLILSQVGQPSTHARVATKGPKSAKTDEAGDDKPAAAETAELEKGGPAQMAKLLRLDNEKPSDRINFTDGNGRPILLIRSKVESVENLRKIGGDPDEIHKVEMKTRDPAAKPIFWKMYNWGSLLVLVDDTAHTRGFAMLKAEENAPAQKSAGPDAPATADPKTTPDASSATDVAPPAEDSKPKPKKPVKKWQKKKAAAKDTAKDDVKDEGKKPPVKDDEKDVFDK